MRDYFEEIEIQNLSPLATKSRHSKGRVHSEEPCPYRTFFQRDRDRVIHSKSFRRLKHKTQVFVATESDHYRSRLTHTLEVTQISRALARALKLNEDLSETVALAHDLGHTPFGHAGERELNRLMTHWGGFEHNRQSLRVVDQLELKYPLFPGLNLSYEVRQGLIKHRSPFDNPNLKDRFVSLEAQVTNLADEIAYNIHDIDDGLTSQILIEEKLSHSVTLWRESKTAIQNNYSNVDVATLKYLINSHLISTLIKDVIVTSERLIQSSGIHSIDELQQNKKTLIDFSHEILAKNKELRHYLFSQFYSHPSVSQMNQDGQTIISKLFSSFDKNIQILPLKYQDRIRESHQKERVIADYIAGMTDLYARKEFEQICC